MAWRGTVKLQSQGIGRSPRNCCSFFTEEQVIYCSPRRHGISVYRKMYQWHMTSVEYMTYPIGMRTCLARSCSNTAGLRGARALVFLCMVIDSTLSKQKESTTSQSLVLMIIIPNHINFPFFLSLSSIVYFQNEVIFTQLYRVSFLSFLFIFQLHCMYTYVYPLSVYEI